MRRPISSARAWEQVERHEQQSPIVTLAELWQQQEAQGQAERASVFFEQVTAPSNIAATTLAPRIKAFYDINAPLATREHFDYGVQQILFAIVRAGNHGFGIVGAYGNRLPDEGFMFVNRLCQDPHDDRPHYIAHLAKGHQVSIGGPDSAMADLKEEGHHIVIAADARNDISVQGMHKRKNLRSIFQLITSEGSRDEEDQSYDLLRNEIGIWSPPPDFIQRKAAKTLAHKKKVPALQVVQPPKSQPVTLITAKKNTEAPDARSKRKPSRAQLRREGRQLILEAQIAIAP